VTPHLRSIVPNVQRHMAYIDDIISISENQNANLMDLIFAIKAAVLSFENCASNMACRRGLKTDEQEAKDLSNFTES
jgi:hypothetical protein